MDIVLDGGLEKMWNEDFQLTKNIQKTIKVLFDGTPYCISFS
ncbi:798_t:CDS:2 [Entrophospora sp. SA101]|nr:798_t:CDS:2 [Entrophospora sp. SA101]